MHVTVSSTFSAAIRGEMEALVRAGFEGVECADVEAHVKARSRYLRQYVLDRGEGTGLLWFRRRADAARVAAAVGGEIVGHRPRNPAAHDWSARTYNGVPSISTVRPGMRFLVTFMIPADPRRLTRYPARVRDPRLKTGPAVRFECWHDELFHIAAHEARHVHQFRCGLPRSELDAERWAAAALARRRG